MGPGALDDRVRDLHAGSVGGVEAALTAALLSYGVDSAAASIVLLFRILTFWLPAVRGYLFLQFTQRKGMV